MVSGLNVGSKWCDQLSIEMMVDYIAGQLGGANVRPHPFIFNWVINLIFTFQDQKMCCNIVRVIIAGNSITDKPIKSAISTKTNQVSSIRDLRYILCMEYIITFTNTNLIGHDKIP